MANLIAQRTNYVRSENGIDVYVLKTPTKDVVTCMMAFKGGGLYASYSKQSVISILSELLPSGTNKKSKYFILEKFEILGASVSVSHSGEYMLVTLASRNASFLEAFQLFLEVLTNAVFTTQEFTSALSRVENAYIHAEEDTRVQATTALRRAMYQKGHPHWVPTPKQLRHELQSNTRDTVSRFYKDTFSALGSVVCIVGDVQPKKIIQVLQNSLGIVPSIAPRISTTVHPEKTNNEKHVERIITIKNKSNIDTFVGIPLAITRDHTDFEALQVAVSILGGSSSSRLFTTLRTQKNLTYGSYAKLAGFTDGYPGFLSAQAIFPKDVYTIGKPLLEESIQVFIKKGVLVQEVQVRKEELIGRYKVGLSTTRGMCSTLFGTVLRGESPSYIDEYPEKVTALSQGRINKVIKEHVDFSLAKTVASGAIDKTGKPI